MANTNAPFGFRVVKSDVGGRHVTRKVTIATGYGTAIGEGDPVRFTGTLDNVEKAVSGSTDAVGVLAQVMYFDSEGKHQIKPNWPASTAGTQIEAIIIPLHGNRFQVQTDTFDGTVNKLADWTIGAPGTNGKSTTVLAGSAAGATGKAFRIDKLATTAGNAVGAYAVVEGVFIETNTSYARTEIVGG